MVCFSSGQCTMYKDHLLRHHVYIQIGRWNGTLLFTIGIFGFEISTWARIVCKQHWDLFCYVAHLPEHRWVSGILAWNPAVRFRQVGRPEHVWDHKIAGFGFQKELGHWMECARDKEAWLALSDLFYNFCMAYREAICKYRFVNIVGLGSPPVPKTGSPHRVQALTLTLTNLLHTHVQIFASAIMDATRWNKLFSVQHNVSDQKFFMVRNYMHTSLQRVTAQLSENRMANDGPRIFSNNFDTMVCGEDLVQHGNI